MGTKDKRVDAYIAKSADFAQPILLHLRHLVHKACPDAEENIKWGFPHFDYHGIFCSMAAFQQHCAFGFWKASLMSDLQKNTPKGGEAAMGDFGRLTKFSDLPSDKILTAYIKQAARLNEAGVPIKKKLPPSTKKELVVPDYFKKALGSNKKALATFKGFGYSNKKEYVEWVTEAKTDATRHKRLATAVKWMAAGKIRNWKYVRT